MLPLSPMGWGSSLGNNRAFNRKLDREPDISSSLLGMMGRSYERGYRYGRTLAVASNRMRRFLDRDTL